MHIFKIIISLLSIAVATFCSGVLALLIFLTEIQKPDKVVQAYTDAHLLEKIVPAIVDHLITEEVLIENNIRFLTLDQARLFIVGLFSQDWLNAHLVLFTQQVYRLSTPGAQVTDSVFILSLKEPKSYFISSFEALKPSIDDRAFGDIFAGMDPRAITETVPDTINLLHILAGHQFAISTPTPYDPFGLHTLANPLSAEAEDTLLDVQQKVDILQLWNARIHLFIPLVILAMIFFGAVGALLHASQHIDGIIKWWGIFLISIALPWILAAIFLRFGLRGRFFQIKNVPLEIMQALDPFFVRYGQLLSGTFISISIALLLAGILCIVIVPRLHRQSK